MLTKSTEDMSLGIVDGVKASISRGKPGTAADMSVCEPRPARISESSFGYAWISHAFSELGICL